MEIKEKRALISKYENEILELVDNQDDFTRGDLQGVAMGIVNKLIIDIEKIKVGNSVVVAYEGGEKEIKIGRRI